MAMARDDGKDDSEGKHKHGEVKIKKTTVAQQAHEVVGQSVNSTQKKRRGNWATVAWHLDEARCRVFICRAKSIWDRYSTCQGM